MTDLSAAHHFAQPHPVRAPRGAAITCRNWLIEAAYRMIQNNLDPHRGGHRHSQHSARLVHSVT